MNSNCMQLHVQFRLLGSTRGTDGFTLCFPSSIGPPPLADIQICCFHSFSDRVLCSHPCAIAVSSPPVSPRCMPHPVLARLSPIVCLSPFRRMTGTAGGGFWQPNGWSYGPSWRKRHQSLGQYGATAFLFCWGAGAYCGLRSLYAHRYIPYTIGSGR